MQIDLPGRLRNIRLPKTKVLLPIFEAVVNSIHAIEDSQIENGKIDVLLLRDNQQTGFLVDGNLETIKGFKIIDNGIGFENANFLAFQTSDTTFKNYKGSKGIGRFLWLKVFGEIRITSIYKNAGHFYRRKFNFTASDEGINNHTDSKLETVYEKQTEIEFNVFDSEYSRKCPQDANVIARKIIEHCLMFFILNNVPNINVIDGDLIINLNDYFHKKIVSNSDINEHFLIKNQEFKLFSLKLYGSSFSEHKLHYCAQNRNVLTDKLEKYIPDLADLKKIKDDDGTSFIYLAYLIGSYFDDRVNVERTNFNIVKNIEEDQDENQDDIIYDEIYMDEIREKAISVINKYLQPFLTEAREQKEIHIKKYINSTAPQYRPLLKYHPDIMNNIRSNLSDTQLNLELFKQYHEKDLSLKKQITEVIESNDSVVYKEKFNLLIQEINDFGKSKLSEYIVHRKVILNIFEKNLHQNSDNDYALEKDVHQIIFPLKKTSDDVDFENQNLWMIDEKLAYHKYLASDKPFNKLEEISIDNNDRPDLLIFNNPYAFVQDAQPYSSIVIIEFKRPMRTSYGSDDNPIDQVYGYIRKIKSGDYKDKNGRLVSLPQNIPFYGYIICDLTKKIREYAEDKDYFPTPDCEGYTGHNRNLNAYVEIISFTKLLNDAKKRNNILFDKLHLL